MSKGPPKGSQYWKLAKTHGKPCLYTPETLWDAACEYFQWVEDNPIQEAIIYQGEVSQDTKSLMRAMTMKALWLSLGIVNQTWYNYKAKPEYQDVIEDIEAVVYCYKFDGAAAGLLDPRIIARDLGLVDKTETTHEAGDGLKRLLQEIDGKNTGLPNGDA